MLILSVCHHRRSAAYFNKQYQDNYTPYGNISRESMGYTLTYQRLLMITKSTIITACLCLLIQTPSFAGVYKWVDENGQVHYGEQPVGTDAEKVKIRHNETTKPRAMKKAEDGTAKDGDKEKTAEVEPEMKEVPVPKKEKRKLCNEAKSDIASINSRGRMREISKDGEYTYLSEEQRQQRLAAAKKKQREYCR